MPFTDEKPFLDAILARDHDDAPRLVYADFLEDSGDPERAELIRVQLAIARMSEEHPRRGELADREAELLVANLPRWTEHIADLLAGPPQFRRGIIDAISVDTETFLSRGEELRARVRFRRLRLIDDAGLLPKLIHSPLLAEVRELDLCDNDLGNGGVELVVRSQYLIELEVLDLGFNGVDDAGVVALARASTLPALTVLSLNDNGAITADGLSALAGSPFFAGLTVLDVSGNDIGEAGVRAALASESFARIHSLNLSRNPIGDAGVAALARSPLFARLLARSSRLDLRGHANDPIGPAGAAALAASPALAKCTALDLTGNDLGDHGFPLLLASPHLANLRSLKVGRNQITDTGVVALHDALPGVLARLRMLDLSENRLTRYGMGLLEAARGDSPVALDYTDNVQAGTGESPVSVGEVVPGVLRDVADAAEAAELRRRVAHPRMRRDDPNRPPG